MTNAEVSQRIWWNTLSNYLSVAVRLITGVILFRLLYQEFSGEDFGFWALLWTVFGYGILLDFGFGFTAQKRVAELSVHGDWRKLSEVLSTVFYCYLAVALLFFAVGLFAAPHLVSLLEVSPGNREHYAEVLQFFLCGLGIAFPLGLFPEMLKGQQRISLANVIFCGAMLVNFVLVALGVRYDWGLKSLLGIALCSTFIPDLICGWFALRAMPEVSLSPRFFSRRMIRETMSFSLYAYVTTLTTILLLKTDQVVIGTTLAVAAVAIYQAGAKVAEMFGGLTQQLPDSFSPAAAHLNARGDRRVLRKLLVDGTRFSVMLATPLYIICVAYMERLLRLLTGEAVIVPETYWVAQILLLWCYTLVLTQSVPKRIFMMCGHERTLMLLGLGEAVLNLALSLALILTFRNVIGVALGSLVASSLFGWLYLWPWAAREAGLSSAALAKTVLGPTFLACLPLLLFLLIQEQLSAVAWLRQSIVWFLAGASIAAALGGAGLWYFAMTTADRDKVGGLISRLFRRRGTA